MAQTYNGIVNSLGPFHDELSKLIKPVNFKQFLFFTDSPI